MGHLIRGVSLTTQADALRQLEQTHTFLVDRASDSLSQLALRRESWGSFAKLSGGRTNGRREAFYLHIKGVRESAVQPAALLGDLALQVQCG